MASRFDSYFIALVSRIAGADPGKNPTGALYASKWAWSGVVALVEVIMTMDFRYRINNV